MQDKSIGHNKHVGYFSVVVQKFIKILIYVMKKLLLQLTYEIHFMELLYLDRRC